MMSLMLHMHRKYGGSFTSDAFIWAGEKIQDWVEKGYFNEGYNSLATDNGEDRALLYDNTCAMMLQGSWQDVRNFVGRQSGMDRCEPWRIPLPRGCRGKGKRRSAEC